MSQNPSQANSNHRPTSTVEQPIQQQHAPPQIPPGVLSIYQACAGIYKTQPNPLQVTAVRKYW